jgi:protoporphyrinogen oxidase
MAITKTAIIIGAGPAGLTSAYELVHKTNIKPIIYEQTSDIGGISKTINYKNNRIDIGGHRFFSKSAKVMQWWENIMPLQGKPAIDDIALDRKISVLDKENAPDPENNNIVLLIRNRLSRILFLKKFFNYPITLSLQTIKNLGIKRVLKIFLSYIKIKIKPIKNEKSLEDFFKNRFGRELYLTFFKSYTEKVWGASCDEIKPEWGAQRVKGLSISKAIVHSIKNIFVSKKTLEQENIETSLIEQFLYPKFGPGQLWEIVAEDIKKNGGEIYINHKVKKLIFNKGKIAKVKIENLINNNIFDAAADYFFSSMPVKELITNLQPKVPDDIYKIADGLVYRDFITVGLLLKKLKIKNLTKIKTINNIIPDNWIYIQEKEVKLGRIQIFNNWSPYMVADLNNVWIGLEYFCNENDGLWNMPEKEFIDFAIKELLEINLINKEDILDSVQIKILKTYPAYFGTYEYFYKIRNYTDKIENLFLIGRNGMHRYNNQDHSMLTAMTAVDNIINGIFTKDNIWDVNTEREYHETKNTGKN